VAKWVKELDTDVLQAELASGGRGIADEPKDDVLGHADEAAPVNAK
jgi:aerobic C4-dicarboxylate transport protein